MSRLSGNKLIDGWLSDRSMAGGAGWGREARAAREGGAPAQRRGGPPQATHCLTCNNSVGLANPESSVLAELVTVNCIDLLRCPLLPRY